MVCAVVLEQCPKIHLCKELLIQCTRYSRKNTKCNIHDNNSYLREGSFVQEWISFLSLLPKHIRYAVTTLCLLLRMSGWGGRGNSRCFRRHHPLLAVCSFIAAKSPQRFQFVVQLYLTAFTGSALTVTCAPH